MVTPSPEPVSNAALSVMEDVGAVGLIWTATHHPLAAALLVAAAIAAALAMARWMVRAALGWWARMTRVPTKDAGGEMMGRSE